MIVPVGENSSRVYPTLLPSKSLQCYFSNHCSFSRVPPGHFPQLFLVFSHVHVSVNSGRVPPRLLSSNSRLPPAPLPGYLPTRQRLPTNLTYWELEQSGIIYGWKRRTFTFVKQTLSEWLTHLYSIAASFDHDWYLDVRFRVVQATGTSAVGTWRSQSGFGVVVA